MKIHHGLFILGVLICGGFAFAQAPNSAKVPKEVQDNCLLTSTGTIDTCPSYRALTREINRELYLQRSDALHKGNIAMYDYINSLKGQNYTGDNAQQSFAQAYRSYLIELFQEYYAAHLNDPKVLEDFFQTTYFQDDQDGLSFTTLDWYASAPRQYDPTVYLQARIRNFSPNPISNIEDMYCFSTINGQDYIYPLHIQPSFNPNSVTNLVIELKLGTSPLLEKLGPKTLACTLVYTQFGQERYSNRQFLRFNLAPTLITSP